MPALAAVRQVEPGAQRGREHGLVRLGEERLSGRDEGDLRHGGKDATKSRLARMPDLFAYAARMDQRCLIAGCGYTGLRLARRLQPRWQVTAAGALGGRGGRHCNAAGIATVPLDLDATAAPGALAKVADGAAIAYLVPPPDSGTSDPRLERFLAAVGPARPTVLLYMSTTGVYGDTGGAAVTEDSPVAPGNDRSQRRVAAESIARGWCEARGVRCVVLRVPGIYGPGRLPLERLQRGEPTLRPEDAGPGNRIHVDDLVTACVAALERPVQRRVQRHRRQPGHHHRVPAAHRGAGRAACPAAGRVRGRGRPHQPGDARLPARVAPRGQPAHARGAGTSSRVTRISTTASPRASPRCRKRGLRRGFGYPWRHAARPSRRCMDSATTSSSSTRTGPSRCPPPRRCAASPTAAPASASTRRWCSSRRAAPAPTSTTASSTPTAPRWSSAATARAASRAWWRAARPCRDRALAMDSPGGLVNARLRPDGLVSVAMGVPDFDPRSLPFDAEQEAPSYRIELPSGPVEFGAVSIGNPHAVIRVRSVRDAPVDTVGPAMENHAALSAPGERRLPRDRGARPRAAARVRARRRRDAGLRHRRLRRGRGRPPARAARRGSPRGRARRHGSSCSGPARASRSGSPARPKRPSKATSRYRTLRGDQHEQATDPRRRTGQRGRGTDRRAPDRAPGVLRAPPRRARAPASCRTSAAAPRSRWWSGRCWCCARSTRRSSRSCAS